MGVSDMAIDEYIRKAELAKEYASKIEKRDKALQSALSKEQYEFLAQDENNTIYCELAEALRKPEAVPSQYIKKKLTWLFDMAIPKSEYDIIAYFADRLYEYPHSDSYMRRSFRAKSNSAYTNKLANIIRRYSDLGIVDAPLDEVLNGELPEDAKAYLDTFSWYEGGYTQWQVAYALDQNNTKVEEAVRRIITEENASVRMTSALIRGVLCSHRSDFHELIGQLLLAARLQEGLRQTICESADCGTKDGFLTILKVIDENNLIRFSSVKRAVGTWLGILTEESGNLERISKKSIRLIIDCLESDVLREEYLSSEDAMKIYVALWSYGFYDIDAAYERISRIVDDGISQQLLVAGYFAANLDLPYMASRLARKVIRRYHDSAKLLAVWLPCLVPSEMIHQLACGDKPVDYTHLFDNPKEFDECYQILNNVYSSFTGKSKMFSPCVFPWYEAQLSKSDLAKALCALAALSGDSSKIDETCRLIKELSSDQRSLYFKMLLNNPKTQLQRKAVLEAIADKGTLTRSSAYKIAGKLKLSEEEYQSIEGYLRFKNSSIRNNVIKLLLNQGNAELSACISRLLDSTIEEIRLGGLDMLMQLKKDSKREAITDSFCSRLSERSRCENIPAKEKILLDSLISKSSEAQAETVKLFTEDDKYLPTEFDEKYISACVKNFLEYFPESKLPELISGESTLDLFGKIKATITGNSTCKSAATAINDLKSLSELISEHSTDSFVNSSGEAVLVGNVRSSYAFVDENGELPLFGVWKEWFTANNITNKRIVNALVMYYAYTQKTPFSESCADYIKTVFGVGFEYRSEIPYSNLTGILLNHFLMSEPSDTLSLLASAIAIWFIKCVPNDAVMLNSPVERWQVIRPVPDRAHLLAHSQLSFLYSRLSCKNDVHLKNTFPLAVASAEKCIAAYKQALMEHKSTAEESHSDNQYYYFDSNMRILCSPNDCVCRLNAPRVDASAYLYAAYRGIITKAQLYEFLLDSDNIEDSLRIVTAVAANYFENGRQVSGHVSYGFSRSGATAKAFLDGNSEDVSKITEFVVTVYNTVIPVILSSELSRGDSPAAYTKGIHSIARIYGTNYLVEILAAMGNDTIERSTYYGRFGESSRKESLSYLLSVCIPEKVDTADTLRMALAGRKITAKRLIEAALYSPEWIPIIGQYLGIESFESVCYYFMAHMDENFDGKRKAMIARFTPLSDDELNLGAFDANWFRSAYEAVGEKEFELIYDAAKYISSGSKHSRARKYADATLGKLDVDDTEKAISDKRNKDLLMAYALIPLKGEYDIFRRYLFIQRFRKESKQFGSQRAASEDKAAEMALGNLAINAGYSDKMRLTLRMETKMIDDRHALLNEQIIEGVSFKIAIDENGKASLTVSKDGKQLKSIPTKLKKHEIVEELINMVKMLNEQCRRTHAMLESAMEDGTVFTFGELTAFLTHPVVFPMLKKLVLIRGDRIGFLAPDGLSDYSGVIHKLEPTAEVSIAHPYYLYKHGCWREYQKYLFDNKIVQPFRQVFRELYMKTADEVDTYRSLRYSGNQIQPAKTVSVLKKRRWVADIEAGLQKVYYKENIVVQIYALADWFSPADIEAPTLEYVCFSDRKTGAEIKIADVPDVIFSEAMRDVDLAVSVAHAGGVDPETSHSTVEMRAAILSFVLPMFRIENVRIEDRHAIIKGKLAEYSVHLGSGVIHQVGGAMIPVLPIHSQHKGRVFLPFVDDDPKTAEIISEVLLFAEDTKIKDPMILSLISK